MNSSQRWQIGTATHPGCRSRRALPWNIRRVATHQALIEACLAAATRLGASRQYEESDFGLADKQHADF
jgi:hypothetical protein